MKKMVIRNVIQTDIKAIMEIEKLAATLFTTLPLSLRQQLPKKLPFHNKFFYKNIISDGLNWALVIDDEIIGFICTKKVLSENSLHIEEFNIAPSFQRRGFGKNLLKFVVNFARQENISQLTLTTFKDVPWNAPFYKKIGFLIIEKERLNERLKQIIQQEDQIGLYEKTRCVMVLSLSDTI